jgi:hypothetical protein
VWAGTLPARAYAAFFLPCAFCFCAYDSPRLSPVVHPADQCWEGARPGGSVITSLGWGSSPPRISGSRLQSSCQRDCVEYYPGARDASVRRRPSVSDASFAKSNCARYRLRRAVSNKRSRVESYIRAGFAFSGLELRLMTLSTKYQEFVRQQVKQPSSVDFDPDVYCAVTRMALGD